jgi:Oxidoreductase family, C-terminal alpha/beta domain
MSAILSITTGIGAGTGGEGSWRTTVRTRLIVRWGLRVDLPRRVTCGGGRYHFDDDQETPDTNTATYDFGHAGASWENHSCAPRGMEGDGFGAAFFGDAGSLVISGAKAVFYDMKQKPTREIAGGWDDKLHFANFIAAVRGEGRLNAPLSDSWKSSMLCHLGNIAYRTGRTLDLDSKTGRPIDNADAAKLWRREYRRGWAPTS